MLRAGLTGGIASGKSTVAAMLRDRNCPVLDLDALGHELLLPGQATYNEVVREFGPGIVGADNCIDRAKLGAIVFADAAQLQRLNQILHPPILRITRNWFESLDKAGASGIAFVEAALIVEAAYNQFLDLVVVCWCRPEQQIERLQKRGFSVEQAQQRIVSQMPVDKKRELADEVIDCSISLADTERQVDALLEELKQEPAAQPEQS